MLKKIHEMFTYGRTLNEMDKIRKIAENCGFSNLKDLFSTYYNSYYDDAYYNKQKQKMNNLITLLENTPDTKNYCAFANVAIKQHYEPSNRDPKELHLLLTDKIAESLDHYPLNYKNLTRALVYAIYLMRELCKKESKPKII
ncbi:MAG: hypothetical protein Q7J54_03955 [Candidatus Woesearchaeota archaeon]|nr:hypothetical protein [Candidatus Woesearchaeota archaeon]